MVSSMVQDNYCHHSVSFVVFETETVLVSEQVSLHIRDRQEMYELYEEGEITADYISSQPVSHLVL